MRVTFDLERLNSAMGMIYWREHVLSLDSESISRWLEYLYTYLKEFRT